MKQDKAEVTNKINILSKAPIEPKELTLRAWGVNHQRFIIIGLFLSSIGDALLEVNTKDPLYFIGGLLFFLLAHISYIRSFLEQGPEKKTNLRDTISIQFTHIPNYVASSILFFLVGLLYIVLPKVNNPDGTPDFILRIAVTIYGSVISIMLATAVNRLFAKQDSQFGPSDHSKICAVLGAIIFMVSDSFIAINKFVVPVPYGKVIVMVTYYLGQFLIARSAYFAKPIPKNKYQ